MIVVNISTWGGGGGTFDTAFSQWPVVNHRALQDGLLFAQRSYAAVANGEEGAAHTHVPDAFSRTGWNMGPNKYFVKEGDH